MERESGMPARHQYLEHGKVSERPDDQERRKRVSQRSPDRDGKNSKITTLELVYEIIGVRTLKPNLEFLGDVARHEEAGRRSEAGWPNPGRVVQL